ncbi:glutaryl-7-ACA acylase [Gemmatimonadetes bacterium T265]|nr:glutaryl-7-ACA acylase [Gemmatimonadetes bacterium T265]
MLTPRTLPAALFLLTSAAATATATATSTASAQSAPTVDSAYVRAHYLKREVRIPMRDGVQLFTSIYVPRDTTHAYPVMLDRTPYSVAPYGADAFRPSLGPSSAFTREGFVFVYQDVRGRYMSEGAFYEMTPHNDRAHPATTVHRGTAADVPAGGRLPVNGILTDESTDTYDTIEWILKNVPHVAPRVGIWGISYPGFYTAAGSIDAHPALVASSPQAPMTDEASGDDVLHGGAQMLAANFGFDVCFSRPVPNPAPPVACPFDPGTPDGYAFYLAMGPVGPGSRRMAAEGFARGLKTPVNYASGDSLRIWEELIAHPNYDAYWAAKNTRPHLRDMRPAMLVVGGWYDAEDLFGALATYRAANAQSPRGDVRLVMGPWSHGQWSRGDADRLGNARFDAATGPWYRDSVEFPFFLHHLKGAPAPDLPEALVFETGRNAWRRYPQWPPAAARPMALTLGPAGTLALCPRGGANGTLTPACAAARAATGTDTYVSDPAHPVPFTEELDPEVPREYMTADQRLASRRPDVLVYQTAPLAEDVTIAGPVAPTLRVSTSGTDADYVVKLIDVFPDSAPDPAGLPEGFHYGGYQQLVRGEPMRARFRDSFTTPKPMTPNTPTRVAWTTPDVNHTFRRGHRIMVQLQSTWFPLVDRNPQTFVPNINFARPEDFKAATMRVYHGGIEGSKVEVLVMP